MVDSLRRRRGGRKLEILSFILVKDSTRRLTAVAFLESLLANHPGATASLGTVLI